MPQPGHFMCLFKLVITYFVIIMFDNFESPISQMFKEHYKFMFSLLIILYCFSEQFLILIWNHDT